MREQAKSKQIQHKPLWGNVLEIKAVSKLSAGGFRVGVERAGKKKAGGDR